MLRSLHRLIAEKSPAVQRDVVALPLADGRVLDIQRIRDPRAKRIKLSVDERGARLTLPLRASLVSGDYDYFIRIAVKDTRDYERLLREKLYKIPGIRHSKSNFVLRVLKDENVPVV